ncbi:MAG: sulfurtransferase TusA family protein [Nitrospirales bacterium]|nr:sulfurtransferase TusA family protein [Nitrospira sp.]MDR4501223.1 sulfurtransferase TusA family protein [Nitrospirales bacterium]
MSSAPATRPAIQTMPIPQEILEEIETFEDEVTRLQNGETPVEVFKPFRLQFGIYGQRQADVQMVRIKIPFGGLTANQLRRVAELADTYATGVGHVTTRQDIQLHFVPLPQVVTIMRKLAEVGLTTREACANTVRNVTACALAGICPGEVFDVTPYANTVAQHLLRNPLTQSLPRKFKIAFSGCQSDCALTPIHDVGLLATRNAEGTIGFRMVVGGGLGSTPRMAKLLREFVPMEELIPSIEACIKVFDNLGNRKNRSKARMKFVIDKLGFDEFKRQWREAYDLLLKSGGTTSTLTILPYQDEAPLIMPTKNGNGASSNGHHTGQGANGSNGASSDFDLWKKTNVITQRQSGFLAAVIKLPWGDMTTEQMYTLADFAETYANGNIRTTINQNMIIRWIPELRIHELYQSLTEHNLHAPGAEDVEDIVACPGTDTCGLGITSSKGLARALAEVFPAGKTPKDLEGVDIKISGCHNSCAQHHIATIGLHGVGKRIGDHIAPVYELHLGGQVNGTAKIGQLIVKVPAKNVPAAIQHILDFYRQERKDGESLHAFITRVGKLKLKEELIPHTLLPAYEESPEYYIDWEADQEFSVEDLGPGECAGGALEMIDNRILEAEQELYHARILSEKHQYGIAINKAYRAVIAGAKAILVTEGTDPNTDADTLAEFDQLVAAKGLLPEAYRNLTAQMDDIGSKDASTEFLQNKLAFARDFVGACRLATDEIGQDLKLAPVEMGTEQASSATQPEENPVEASASEATVYDLRGVACPMNYVKTKLKLEMMDEGEKLEVWLDAGDPIKNVPMSLRNDGHKVLAEEAFDSTAQHYKVLVEKVEA